MKSILSPSDPCPICNGINSGNEPGGTLITPDDIVFINDYVVALINSFFIPGNEGHVIIVSKQHYQNLYDLPLKTGHKIFEVSQKIAIAIRHSYPNCGGITIRQNNELIGDQHAYHYHMHVIPRYENDLYNEPLSDKLPPASTESRAYYARLLRNYLSSVM